MISSFLTNYSEQYCNMLLKLILCIENFNPFSAKDILIDFTLSNAR